MKKTLLIFAYFFPPHVGGGETHVYEFARHLSEKEYNIVIFTPNIPKTKEIEKIKNNLKVIRYPSIELMGNPVPKFWKLKFWNLFKIAIKEKPDFVMSRTRFFFPSFFCFLFAKLTKTKHIHVEQGSDFLKTGNWFKDRIAKIYDLTIGKLILSKADCCVAISDAVYKFVKKFRSRKIFVIRRGLEMEEMEKINPDKFILKNYGNKIKICFVGRLIYWKGLHNALNGFLQLPEELKRKCIFFIVGSGPEKKDYESRYKNQNIKFLGEVSREKALSIIKSCDIFVHSTISGGGLSCSLLEAMYLGKAIVATPAEGANEVIFNNKTGVLLKNSSPEEFKKGFEILLKDEKLRKKLGENAKKYIKENFSWDKKIEQYVKLFNKMK